MIKPILTDPNNHVPEVSPDDEWGDAETLHSSGFGSSTVLPLKKKPRTEGEVPVSNGGQCLRIAPKPSTQSAADTPRQLEVREFDGTVLRLAPEPDGPEKVPRQFTFVERPPEDPEKRMLRGEANDWGHARKHPLPWLVGTAAGVVSLIVGALMLLPTINQSNAARPPSTGLAVEDMDDNGASKLLNGLLTRQPEAEQLFHAYASASIPDDILPLIVESDALKPLIRDGFIPNRIPKSWILTDDTTWEVFDNTEKPYGILRGKLPGFSKFCAYLELTGGRLLIDWKATSAYGTASFQDLYNGTGNPKEIRGWIIPDTYYTSTFPEAEYDSYQFFSPDQKAMIWCYARHESAVAEEIAGVFNSGAIIHVEHGPRKVTLRLERGPDGTLPNQWLAAGLHHMEWISPKH